MKDPEKLKAAAWFLVLISALCFGPLARSAHADRLKEMARVQGVRDNQLIGYGLVVGLDGSGDQTTQTPFTTQSLQAMLSQLGVQLPPGTSLQLKNVAAVMVTATLPAFTRSGQTIDLTVSSLGNAKSLRGGTLLMTPLKGADGQVYAIAQGNVLVGGVGAAANGSKVQVNHLAVGRVPSGATVEREVATTIGRGEYIYLESNTTDFNTSRQIAEVINAFVGPELASAVDGRVVRVRAPVEQDKRVEFLARLENLEIVPAKSAAKVIVNARTGSVVMNQTVTIEPCAVAHGNLSVIISTEPVISQPNVLSLRGDTVQAQRSNIEIREDKGGLVTMPAGVSLAEVVKALNSIGATPQDLLAILQAMKSAGVLRADLEII
ncbi:MAG: flagellar basal body P-ring protein FlgI [Betaproteobacteria bacterium]|nr:flagellar basal body P-ring protein FlgI [Betaproteobacteria bacterium]